MPALPTPEAWAQIRYEYEDTRRPVEDICRAHGISPNTLRRPARQWGWRMRHPPIPAEGPPPAAPPVETAAVDVSSPERAEVREAVGDGPGEGMSGAAVGADADIEPSPHIAAPVSSPVSMADTRPIGERLQGAVSRVLPAIEATLARLTAGPMRPREMEQAARALGSLTRTLRELNGLLVQHGADEPPKDVEELRRSLAQKLEAVIEREREETPRRYLAGWNEFAAEAEQAPGR